MILPDQRMDYPVQPISLPDVQRLLQDFHYVLRKERSSTMSRIQDTTQSRIRMAGMYCRFPFVLNGIWYVFIRDSYTYYLLLTQSRTDVIYSDKY